MHSRLAVFAEQEIFSKTLFRGTDVASASGRGQTAKVKAIS